MKTEAWKTETAKDCFDNILLHICQWYAEEQKFSWDHTNFLGPHFWTGFLTGPHFEQVSINDLELVAKSSHFS